ncbi:Ribonuclease/ribotoxin [Elaphomyces granulatus]
MQFTKAFLALALVAAPIFAAPTAVAEDGQLGSRATTVNCKPKTNASNIKSFKVDVDNAQSQAKVAGFTAGKSGDPHGYGNGDKISWGVTNCDDGKSPLFEYPVFWEGAKQKEWQKDTKSSSQEKTPIRVVYANKNGGIVYCGIMTHSNVDKDYQGKGAFEKCD